MCASLRVAVSLAMMTGITRSVDPGAVSSPPRAATGDVTVDDFPTVPAAFAFALAHAETVRRVVFSNRTYHFGNGTQQGGPTATQ